MARFVIALQWRLWNPGSLRGRGGSGFPKRASLEAVMVTAMAVHSIVGLRLTEKGLDDDGHGLGLTAGAQCG